MLVSEHSVKKVIGTIAVLKLPHSYFIDEETASKWQK